MRPQLSVDHDREGALGGGEVTFGVLGRRVLDEHPACSGGVAGGRCEQRPAGAAGGGGEGLLQPVVQGGDDVTVEPDVQGWPELRQPDRGGADHPLRVRGEHLVDGRGGTAGPPRQGGVVGSLTAGRRVGDGHGPFPGQPSPGLRMTALVARVGCLVAAAQHEQIGQHPCAGGLLVGGAGQPDRGDQLGERSHLPAGGWVGRVQRPMRGQDRDDPARPGQLQRFDDEVVVQAMAAGVVHRVVQRDLAERDVADGQVDRAGRQPGVSEGLGADVGAGVEQLRDRRGGRVQLHPDQLGGGRRGQPRNTPAPQPGSRTRPPVSANPAASRACQTTRARAASV